MRTIRLLAGFAYTAADRQLADRMSRYWVNFVATGDPNGKGLPRWPPYRPDTEPYLEFGDTIRAGQHVLKTELDFQEKALKRRANASSSPRNQPRRR